MGNIDPSQDNTCQSNEALQSGDMDRKLFDDAPGFYRAIQGAWKGDYRLWLNPDGPPDVSISEATVRTIAHAAYCVFSYQWSQGENHHEGVFLLTGRNTSLGATWGDSFHSVPDPMQCDGRMDKETGKLIFNGKYPAGDGSPDWGWRTEFWLSNSGVLTMEAYNISPDGVARLAVRCELKQATS